MSEQKYLILNGALRSNQHGIDRLLTRIEAATAFSKHEKQYFGRWKSAGRLVNNTCFF